MSTPARKTQRSPCLLSSDLVWKHVRAADDRPSTRRGAAPRSARPFGDQGQALTRPAVGGEESLHGTGVEIAFCPVRMPAAGLRMEIPEDD